MYFFNHIYSYISAPKNIEMNFHSSLYLFLFCILFIYCNYISSLFITSLFCFTEILLFFKAFSNFLFAITEHIIHIIKYTIIITILIDNVNIKYDTAKAIIFDIKNFYLLFGIVSIPTNKHFFDTTIFSISVKTQ